jgi:hypothetical protein
MNLLKFLKGLKEKDLPLDLIKDGSIYHCEDTGNTYLGKEIKNEDGTTASRELLRYSSAVGKTVISLDDNEEEVKGEIFNDYISNQATGSYSHAEGQYAKAFGKVSHAEGRNTLASGNTSHAEGEDTKATGYGSHAEGGITQASGAMSHAEGEETVASGRVSHAEGNGTLAEGYGAHAEGCITQALGYVAHADGENTIASGNMSHAEGCETKANGSMSHAEGYKTKTCGDAGHAEGYETEAYERAHAEGRSSIAEGKGSHAEGYYTHAIGEYSHAEGNNTITKGINSHAEGEEIVAAGKNQHAQGQFNIEDTTLAHIVGNGDDAENRSNAHTLDWEGNAWFAGDVYVNSTSGTNKDEGSKKLATEDFVLSQASVGDTVMVHYDESKVAVADQTEFLIDLPSFDFKNDMVEVYSGRTRLSPVLDYTVTANSVILEEGLPEGRTVDIRIVRKMFIPGGEEMYSGTQILPGSIPLDRLDSSDIGGKLTYEHYFLTAESEG